MSDPTPSEGFDSWEKEEGFLKKRILDKTEAVSEMIDYASQGARLNLNIEARKLDAVIDMLLEAGIVDKKQVLKMQLKVVEDMEVELRPIVAQVREHLNRIALAGGAAPPPRTQGGLILPKG